MLKKSALFLITLLSFSFLTGCNGNATKKEETQETTTSTLKSDSSKTTETKKIAEATEKEYDKKFNEISRVIAGLPVDSSSKYYNITQTVSWKRFAKTMDSSWAKLEKDRLGKVRTWRETELAGVNDGRDLFYPFSGPDFLHAYSFFNKSKNMYMFGLEGAGSLPKLDKKSEKDMVNYYASVQKYLAEIMSKSYFITKKMLANLYRVNGMTPIICIFMVRTGNTVTSIQPMNLDSTGKMVPFDTTGLKVAKKSDFHGVKIDYLDSETKELKSVYFYSGDMADGTVTTKSSLYKYLNNMPENCNGMLKSASYLLHYGTFNQVRNAMMNRCQNILQDDTGIAYRFYKNDKKHKWDFNLYGVYFKPIGDFKGVDQPDLEKAYKDTSKVKPLPFGIGYHWMNRKDSWFLVTKK